MGKVFQEIDEEIEFQAKLAAKLRECRFSVEREELPKYCMDWDKPYQADIVAEKRFLWSNWV